MWQFKSYLVAKILHYWSLIPGSNRWRRRRIKLALRGYSNLKAHTRLGSIENIQKEISAKELEIPRWYFSECIFGAGTKEAEKIIRQYLILRVGYISLNYELLISVSNSKGSLKSPIPKEWRNIVKENGFRVSDFSCSFLWNIYIIAIYIYGVRQILKILVEGFREIGKSNYLNEKYIYFCNLSNNNLPKMKSSKKSHDIISWYIQWVGRDRDIRVISHGVSSNLISNDHNIDLKFQKKPIPSIQNWSQLLQYFLWAFRAIAISTVDLIRGHWWHSFILNQAALSGQARLLSPNVLAKEYFFHQSTWIYRPLWTYEVEKMGSKVTLYFYSTNCEGFQREDGRTPLITGYSTMNWPCYMVWDLWQAKFIYRCVGPKVKLKIVGPIWFDSSDAKMPAHEYPAVAVFDVTPHRISSYCKLGLAFDYYTPDVANRFLSDISEIVFKLNGTMLWKGKRNIGLLAHPSYRYLVDKLMGHSHNIKIDPNVDSINTIISSSVVISMPFTATALIARELKKPSVYYDPSGKLSKKDPATHGIELLIGYDELEDWLTKYI